MYTYNHPRPALTVDVVVFSLYEDQLHVLLIKRAQDPYTNYWALPGGFVEPSETLEDAALRELKEETGLSHAYLEQLYTYGDPQRDPRGRVISVAYYAIIPQYQIQGICRGSDAAEVKWFPVKTLPDLAFDHQEIISYAVNRLKYKLVHTAVGFELLPDVFTLNEILHIYEIIIDEKIDMLKFKQEMIKSGIIESTSFFRNEKVDPSVLYNYRNDAVAEIKDHLPFPWFKDKKKHPLR